MGIDHSKATAIVRFTGLGLLRFGEPSNRDVQNLQACEIGILECKNHDLYIDIQEMSSNGTRVILSSLRLRKDMTIDVEGQLDRKVSKFLGGDIDKVADTGDPEDFRWITDFSSKPFYGTPLPGRQEPSPILSINHGVFYTALRTDFHCARVTPANAGGFAKATDPVFVGRIGYVLGVDISCPDNGAVILKSADLPQGAVRLQKKEGAQYIVNITNDCDDSPVDPRRGTDFLTYYQVLDVPEPAQYDLRHAVEDGGMTSGAITIPETGGKFSLDGSPQLCNLATATIVRP